jgi:ActR/RegA family two-component response regulator
MSEPWRILIIEDDPVFAGALVNALRRRGYAAESAEDARNGLALAEVQVPDAAVLDLKLGDDSGLALIRPLKIINPAMQIVLLTGYASIDETAGARIAGRGVSRRGAQCVSWYCSRYVPAPAK